MRLAERLGSRFGVPLWLSIPTAALLASIPFSMIVDLVAPLFFPQLRGKVSAVEAFIEVLILMLPTCSAFALAQQLLARGRSSKPAATAPPSPQPFPPPSENEVSPLALRLPATLGGDVVALRAEDHYVRVYTPLGSHLILLRLSDAISELGGAAGIKVHRSWWVSYRSIVRTCGQGRKLRLRLVTGLEVPVARTAIADIRARGWPA